MTHAHSPRSLCATTVIAAVLALGTTPALAQTAAPDTTASPPAAATPPAPATPTAANPATTTPDPTNSLPAIQPQTPPAADAAPAPAPQASSSPVIQAIPPGHEPPQATTDTTPTQPTPPAQPAPAPVARHHSPTAIATPIPEAHPAIPPSPLRADQGITPAAPPAAVAQPPRQGHLPDAAWAVALAAAVGATLAGTALIIGRRRREDEDEDGYEAPALAPTPDRTAEIAPAATASPLAAPVLAPRSVAYPDGPTPTGAAREALLERMVAAEPDAENPFTSHKARLHRARLILAGREQALKDKATEPFDWRSYRPSRDRADTDESVIVRDPAHA